MNDLTLRATFSEAPTSVCASLHQGGAFLAVAGRAEHHIALSYLFSKLYVDSLFALEISLAMPADPEPSLLIDTRLMAEEESWGKNQLLFLADDGELES